MDPNALNRVIEWVADSLMVLTEMENSSANVSSVEGIGETLNYNFLFHLLDIINIVCIRINEQTEIKGDK